MRRSAHALAFLIAALAAPVAALAAERFDVVVRGGTVYDGTGGAPRRADLGIRGDRIVVVGPGARPAAH